MRQDELFPAAGSKKDRKRVGRGDSSGHGSFSGKGCKGHKARSGYSSKPGFEGGQMPLTKRSPEKRGFFNSFRTEYDLVNLEQLNRFESGSEITPLELVAAGLVKSLSSRIKILAEGTIKSPLNVKVHKFSGAAKAKIEAAGGSVEEIDYARETS